MPRLLFFLAELVTSVSAAVPAVSDEAFMASNEADHVRRKIGWIALDLEHARESGTTKLSKALLLLMLLINDRIG